MPEIDQESAKGDTMTNIRCYNAPEKRQKLENKGENHSAALLNKNG